MDIMNLPLHSAVSSFALHAHYDLRRGWTVSLVARESHQTWQEASTERYEDLTGSEAFDAVCAELSRLLNL